MANDTPATTDHTARPTYRVTFERIGRNHNVEPLDLVGADNLHPSQIPDSIAVAISRYARPHLRSRDVDVYVDLGEDLGGGRGRIWCGSRNGGEFTIERVSEVTTP